MPLAGYVTAEFGWAYAFYTCGTFSLAWVLVWALLMHDSPEIHPRISEKEKIHIINSIKEGGSKTKVLSYCLNSIFFIMTHIFSLIISHGKSY